MYVASSSAYSSCEVATGLRPFNIQGFTSRPFHLVTPLRFKGCRTDILTVGNLDLASNPDVIEFDIAYGIFTLHYSTPNSVMVLAAS
jgi:hypothetical protein